VLFEHTEDLDLVVADQIDHAIPPLDHFAHVLAIELGHDTPGKGQRGCPLRHRTQHLRPLKLVWTDEAIADLEEIADYIALDKPAAARSRRHLFEPA
jgi:hypothetical protein